MPDDGGVQFEEESIPTPSYKKEGDSMLSVLTAFLVAKGFAKNDQSAEYILLGAVVGIVVLAITIAILSNSHASSPKNINLYIQRMNAAASAKSSS